MFLAKRFRHPLESIERAGSTGFSPRQAAIAEPQDRLFAGTIRLHVDASDTRQGVFYVHQEIPVTGGQKLTLLYPKWLPGNHSPTGPINKLAGLVIRASDRRISWQRDPYHAHAFHVQIPADVQSIDVDFQYLSARNPGEGAVEMTSNMLNLVWSKNSLYPAGHFTRQIMVEASVTLPEGWQMASALEIAHAQASKTSFKPLPYDSLVDSPIYAGKYFKRVDLAPGTTPPVHLNMVADAPEFLVYTDAQLQYHRNLVTQATRLFESQHYAHYDFLLSLSDELSHKGLEHHQSSEDGVRADYFTNWKNNGARRDLLAHEYEHSWNGKFLRPQDNWAPNFNVPMGGSLLWVYEGQTQYWGYVLTARAGMWSHAEFIDALALVAARYDRGRPGFAWRGIADTTNDPSAALRSSLPYRNWQMSEEYYSAGQLLWLGVDSKLRQESHGEISLDTFAKTFFGIENGSYLTHTYTLDDVISALGSLLDIDWQAWFDECIHARKPPLESLAASGWKLVYNDMPSAFAKQTAEHQHTQVEPMYSLGLTLGKGGHIRDVAWQGPAFKAGVSSGTQLVAVNHEMYTPQVLTRAIKTAQQTHAPIELLVKRQNHLHSVEIAYFVGLAYPHLERIEGTADILSDIIAAKD